MNSNQYTDILEFWFGHKSTSKEIIREKSAIWWKKDAIQDKEIADRFGELHQRLANGELESWKAQPESLLAMIILADQFSRNIYRDDERAFAMDPLALSLSLDGMEAAMDKTLRWVERVFFYMPLEHSESLAMQERSVKLFRGLAEDIPGDEQDMVYGHIDFAIKHWEIIKQFGRFPHRNKILGRESTPDEIAFLKQPGSSF